MAKGYGGKGQTNGGNYTKQTRTTSPEPCDKSTNLSGPSVNKDAVRSGPAPYPKTIGPRTA